MTALHVGLLLVKGGGSSVTWTVYAMSVAMLLMKVWIVGSVALFFSLVSSSGVVALSFTFFFWLLGHFSIELRYLYNELHGAGLKILFQVIYMILLHLLQHYLSISKIYCVLHFLFYYTIISLYKKF
jgi:hypothetical protein